MDMLQGTRDYFAPATSLFDLLQPLPLPCDGEKDEFMDMLQGTRDYFAPATSLFDLLQPLPLSPHQPLLSPASTVPESSEVVNTPATPNSSSISSSSTEAANDDQQQSKTPDEQAEQDPQEKTKKTEVFFLASPCIKFSKEGILLAVSSSENGVKILGNAEGVVWFAPLTIMQLMLLELFPGVL